MNKSMDMSVDYSSFPPELQQLFKAHPDTEIDPQCDDVNIKLFFKYFEQYFKSSEVQFNYVIFSLIKYMKDTGALLYRFEPVCEIWNTTSNEKTGRPINLDILDYCIRDRNITFNIRTTIYNNSHMTDIIREFEIKFDESEFNFEITKAPCRHKHYSDNEAFCEYIKIVNTCI
jgi:hypothetical protein